MFNGFTGVADPLVFANTPDIFAYGKQELYQGPAAIADVDPVLDLSGYCCSAVTSHQGSGTASCRPGLKRPCGLDGIRGTWGLQGSPW